MSTLASLPLETMIFGLEKTLASLICSNALMARRKSSIESCPWNPRALRQAMLSAARPAPEAAPIPLGTRPVKEEELEEYFEFDDEDDAEELADPPEREVLADVEGDSDVESESDLLVSTLP